jgi:hypothetical protein
MKSNTKRSARQLPEELRLLAALVELSNLISETEFERFRGAYLKFFQKDDGSQSITQKRRADCEVTSFYEEFSVRCRAPRNRSAVATLLKCMGSVTRSSDETINPVTLFETIATLRSILRTIALELTHQSTVRLPSDTPPVMLGSIEGRIQIIAVPVAYWLLPLLEGIASYRLGICEICQRLYVARRRDQLGCSRKCGDTLYMRRYRNREYRNRNKPGGKRSQIRQATQEYHRSIVAKRDSPTGSVNPRKN